MKAASQLFIAWTMFQRRQVSMAPFFGFQTLFLPVDKGGRRWRKVLSYIANGWATLGALRRAGAGVVWIQLPQVPLLWLVLVYRWFSRRRIVLVADCHNGLFRPPWSRVPLGISLLSRCDVVLVHNDEMYAHAMHAGVACGRLMVVEDPPAELRSGTVVSAAAERPRPWLVFPSTFSPDEPIGELLEAARRTPEVSIMITGNTARCSDPLLIAGAPSNVRFVGFLAREDFEALMVACDGVVAFTRYEGIQLSACGEAVGAGKPMVISDTATLRSLFPSGTVFVDSSDPESIAEGIRGWAEERAELARQMGELKNAWKARWIATRREPLAERIAAALARETAGS